MNKLFYLMGVGIALGVLFVSVVRSTGQSAYTLVVADERREALGILGKPSRDDISQQGSRLLPGSVWNGLYVTFENVRLGLLLNPTTKAELTLSYADERLDWVEQLMEMGEYRMAMITMVKGVGYLVESGELIKDNDQLRLEADTLTFLYEAVLEELQQFAVEGEKDLLQQQHVRILEVRSGLGNK